MRSILLAAALSFCGCGFAAPAPAQTYDLLGYPLGMTFAEFAARPIPESDGKQKWRILCADGPEMRSHMMGVIGSQHDIETRVGARTCVFAEPDLISGPKWWKPAPVNFAGKQMIWIFRFLSAPQGAETQRLFAITALYRPPWEARNAPIDAIEPALSAQFGAGDPLTQDKYTGRIWHSGSQTAEFAAIKLIGDVKQAQFCIGIVDEALLAELNRRLTPFRRQHWNFCAPDIHRPSR